MSGLATIYGPVQSWRVGRSLGIDLLSVNSICSFRCIYCQLGAINIHTIERKVYVSTQRVLTDLEASRWREADVITFSGSGEPTLAANLGEVIQEAKIMTGKPVVVLTNATTLSNEQVRRELLSANQVFCKLDAADERTFRRIARPVSGITLRSVVGGIKRFRAEYKGQFAIQIMLMRLHRGQGEAFARLLNDIRPDELQLNAALRPIPRGWFPEARGNSQSSPFPAVNARTMSQEEAGRIESQLHELTGLKIVSAYQQRKTDQS
jgi:wyosine [tRNA(Phe)-imidazoG37] synthetase (radical SAM superfamily)